MKSQKVIALLLSTALSISTCVPLGSITALGAETGTAAQAVEVQEEVSDSAESAESPEEEEASAAEETVAAEEQEAASQETAAEETEDTENAEDTENVTTEVEDDNNESADETEAAVPAQEEEASEAADSTGGEEADTAASEETAVPAEEPVQNDNVENSTDITAPAQTETVETDAQNSVDFSNAIEIKAGESHNVSITEEGGSVLFRFVPEETAAYSFYSDENSVDPKAWLYDADKSLIDSWDDEKENRNFEINLIFTEGETYYFEAGVYSGTGSYKVHLIKEAFYAEHATDSFRTVFLNDEVTLEVSSFSTSALAYQWYDNDEKMIEGATSAAYTFTAQKNERYHCYVSDENGNSANLYFDIYIDNHLEAYTLDKYGSQTTWSSVYVAPGDSAELNVSVSADDMSALTYEWTHNGDTIEGADSPSYKIESVTKSGTYYFQVSDQYGSSRSVTFDVYVQNNLKAYILDEEGNQSDWAYVDVAPNGSAELKATVTADDMSALTYEWRDSNYNLIEGAHSTSYTIGSVSKSGYYSFQVSDQYGNSQSLSFSIRIENHLTAYTVDEDNNQTTWLNVPVAPKESVELNVTVSADDMTGLTYEWLDDHYNLIEGADSTSYTIGSVTRNGEYLFRVSDSYGNTKTVTFNILVQNHLKAYAEGESDAGITWVSVDVAPNASAELNVTVSADDMTGLTYEWKDNYGNPVEGAGTTSCTIGSVTHNTTYYFRVSDPYGNSEDVTFNVRVQNNLVAYTIDEYGNQTDWSYVHVSPNSTAELNVTVSADDMTGLTYEWRDSNSDLIKDAGTTSCSIGPVTKPEYCYFTVYDQYGNSKSVTFNVSVQNHLEAYTVNEEGDQTTWPDIYVSPNSSAELNVTVSADDMTGLTYEWYDSNDNPVEGADNTTCTIGPVTGSERYTFYVYDQYGNSQYVTFDVHVQNHLEAYFVNEYGGHSTWTTIFVAPNGYVELNATVSADDMTGLTYEWSDSNGNPIEDAGNTSCTVGPVTGEELYYFRVTDPYGNSQRVTFDVFIENHLNAYVIDEYGDQVPWSTVYVAPNGSAELNVTVSADDMDHLTYEWRDSKGYPVEGAGTTSCTVGPVTQNENYYFYVSDQYGNSSMVDFYIHVENHLQAYYVNEYDGHDSWPTVYVAPNGSTDLRVNVSADDMSHLTYEWRDKNDNTIPGADSTSLTIGPVTKQELYTFIVEDPYGNSQYVEFTVRIDNELNAYTIDEFGDTSTYATVYVAPNNSAELSVTVSANDMDHLTYEWRDSEGNTVEGAGTTTCSTGPVTGYKRYYFTVSDQYGNSREVTFIVRAQNNLTADPEGDYDYHVTPGSSVTLKVNVSAIDMTGLQYSWYTDYEETLIQGANSTTYTIGSVTESKEYVFRVSDQYGNTDSVYFYIYADNNLKVLPEGSELYNDTTIYAAPGQALDLKVVATANDPTNLSYQWYNDGDPINGAVSSSYRLSSLTSSSFYSCRVTDRYGNSRNAFFSVIIENHFTAYPEEVDPGDNYKEIFVAPGSSADLKVCVSGDDLSGVTYQWYYGDDTPISGATAASYKVNSVTERQYYVCRVYDKYGNYGYAEFTVSPLDITGEKSIKAGDSPQVSVNEDAPYAFFKFTPTETSGYTLYSTGDEVDSYVEVFNDSYQRLFYNDDDGVGNNFNLTKVFTAGTTYYIRARAYFSNSSEDFTMHLEKDSRKSQVLSASDMTLIKGTNKYITVSGAQGSLHCRSSNSGVAEVSDDGEILTYRTGSTIITIYADGTDEYLPSESIKITVTVTEQIVDINTAAVSGLTARTYNGKAQTQTPVVKIGSTILRAGTDYTVSYKNNTNAGTATVTFTGKGSYTGTKSATFVINKAAQNIALKVSAASIAVGKTATVSITGAVGAKSYKSSLAAVAAVNAAGTITAKKVGSTTITATAAATANYKAASRTVSIKVVPAATTSITAANLATGIKLTWKSVAGATGYRIYRGSKLIKTIKGGSIITCTDTTANANGTLYTFKVFPTAATGTGLGRTLSVYRIARPAVSSVKNTAAKKMTVRWRKNAKANGYQIQYSTNRKFAKGNKTVNITRAATVSKVIGSLVKGKTYYVRIRTYKKVGKSKCWSAWSAAKAVKIKK